MTTSPPLAIATECSVDEWLELAAAAERTARDCGPFDQAYMFFLKNRDGYLRMAVEREEFDKMDEMQAKAP